MGKGRVGGLGALPPIRTPRVPHLHPRAAYTRLMCSHVFTGLRLGAVLSPGVMAAPLLPCKTSWGLALRLEAAAGVALVIPSSYQMLPDQH